MVMKRPERIRSKDQKGGISLMLTENIPNVGKQGEIVKVRAGFARNYLLPNGLATVASNANRMMVERHRARQDAIAAKRVLDLRDIAKKIKDYSVTIEANATDDGHLYGSILATDISKALKIVKFPVEPEHVLLEGPLKELGMYTVRVQLHADVHTEVKVWVVPTAAR